MWADADAGKTFFVHVAEIAEQFLDAIGLPIVVVPSHDLPVGDAMHALRGERVGGLRIGDDVGGRRGA